MAKGKRLSRLGLGALALIGIAVFSLSRHSSKLQPFLPTTRFATGAPGHPAQNPAQSSGSQGPGGPSSTGIADRNKSMAERAVRINKALTSTKGLEQVLEHELGFTPPRIAQMMRNPRYATDTVGSSAAAAAALDDWCLTGPHIVQTLRTRLLGSGVDLFELPENAITPTISVVLIGCGFGDAPGSVRMSLDASGQSFNLTLVPTNWEPNPWGRFGVEVVVPVITGVMDQTATLTLTDSANRVTMQTVPFIAARETKAFDFAHSDLITVNPECLTATTDDSCGAAPVGDSRWPEGRSFVGVHWKFCCRGYDGMDVYSVKLNNGWTAPELAPFITEPGDPHGSGSGSVVPFASGGLTTCWWFGNGPGSAVFWGTFPSTSPDFTFQTQFSWHVDGNCSAVHYDGTLRITGPKDVPYW